MAIMELLQRELPVTVSSNPFRLSRLQMDVLISEIQELWSPLAGVTIEQNQLYFMSREQLSAVESPQRGITTDLLFDQCPAIRVGPDGNRYWRIEEGRDGLYWTCRLEVPADDTV